MTTASAKRAQRGEAERSLKICMGSRIEDKYGPHIAARVPGCEIVCLEADGTFRGEPEGLEIFLLSIDLLEPATAPALPRLLGSPSLRWLQSPGAGVDHPVFPSLLERGVRVTSAAGIHAEPIAQYILAYVLHWERRIAQHLAQEAAREWKVIASEDLTAKTLGIVGLGGIGRAAARAAKAFGMRVIATKRTPAADENVDEILPPKRLDELLAASHYVVLTLPLVDETVHLIGRAELGAMRRDAVLINVARGKVVDEGALIDALRERRIKGATLDVTEEEPLPVDSPLWGLANCIITPHDAGYSPLANDRLAALFLENLDRYLRGEPLRNEITMTGLTPTARAAPAASES